MRLNRLVYSLTGLGVTALLSQPAFSSMLSGPEGGRPNFSWVSEADNSFMALNLAPFPAVRTVTRRASDGALSFLYQNGFEGDFQGVQTIAHGGPDLEGLSRGVEEHPSGTWGRQQFDFSSQNYGVAPGAGAIAFRFGAQPFSTGSGGSSGGSLIPVAVDTAGEESGEIGAAVEDGTDPVTPPPTNPVPLPGAVWLLGFGLLGIGGRKHWGK